MKLKNLLTVCCLALFTNGLMAQSNFDSNSDALLKTFVSNIKRLPDANYQLKLSEQTAWQNFTTQNGKWLVTFNEENQLPHNATGTPVQMNANATPLAAANDFIAGQLGAFNLPISDMIYRNTATNKKYHYVHFNQTYKGLDVLWAHAFVKMTHDNRVMQFMLDVYNNIAISVTPSLNATAALNVAKAGISGITKTSVPVLKVLPVPVYHQNIYHLVYEITVSRKDADDIPAEYYTLIDANTGEVLYRQNNVNHITEVSVTGTVYPTNQYNPTAVEPLKNLRVNVGGTNFFTDNNGYVDLSSTSATTATLYLQGPWAKIETNGVTPNFTSVLTAGSNNAISFDPQSNSRELSAYQSVQDIHDYYKSVATDPSVNAIKDFTMTTNIDVAGACNAFYNGTLNFFNVGNSGGTQCNATSEIADVVYHEYGHSINSDVYGHYGGNFGNGALGEGYADTWANGLTLDPVLGIGFYTNNPTGFVRRYDINKKVYPQDLQGEVHADGEIIAGAWWDTFLNLGSMVDRETLFFETFAATLTAPQGQEGQLFADVLLEALTNDDNDGNLANGTPHYCQITSAFAIHGIFMSGNTTSLTNATSVLSAANQPVAISATITGTVSGSANGYYKVNSTTGNWTNFSLANAGGNTYSASLPAQPNGTIIYYYLDITDNCGTHVNISPAKANDADPNIPFNIMVGYSQLSIDDFDNFMGSWTTGIPSDNATTGLWTYDIPVASYITPGVPTSLVQPDYQNTPGGLVCALTGNANPGDAAGVADVDGGKTTLLSPVFNLSAFTHPAFSYYRWYSNDQGATPGTDFWQVAISNDNGVTWVPVENTNVADHSWRSVAFRVADYVTPTAQTLIRFVAEDANDGSLVEALVDDLVLWDEIPTGIVNNENFTGVSVFPNPVKDILNIKWNQLLSSSIKVTITNDLGNDVYSTILDNINPGFNKYQVNTSSFAQGIYFVRMTTDKSTHIEKVSIIR